MRAVGIVSIVGLLFAIGCSKGKASKCEAGFDQMKEFAMGVAKAFQGDEDKGKSDKDMEAEFDKKKAEFVKACTELPDDAVDCIANLKEKMFDPTCSEKLKNAKLMNKI